MLSHLSQAPGVQQSFVNVSGTVLRLDLQPGADPDKVAGEVRRILGQVAEDRTAERLCKEDETDALKHEWQDGRRAAASEAAEVEPAAANQATATEAPRPTRHWLLALVLASAVVVLGRLTWRRFWTVPEI
jgi:hypothetical protein